MKTSYTVYPYELNDNVRKVGNVTKVGPNRILYALFNKQPRNKSKGDRSGIASVISSLLVDYKYCFCVHTYVFSSPKKCLVVLVPK